MNKNIYITGISVLALLMSGLPVVALAESNRGEGGADTQVTAVTQVRVSDDAGTSVTRVNDDDDETTSSNRRNDDNATSSKSGDDNESINDDQDDQDEIEIELEDDEDRAFSLNDLKLKIEVRKQKLEDEEASTTLKFKLSIKNANEVRLAVHALLASRDLLGGIGHQVSEIAKHMNDSVATTTNAEAKIHSRGFITRLLFGGDSAAADVIADAVAKNQENVQRLTDLLGQASTTPEVKLILEAQIQALEDAQARLQTLSEKEKGAWGLFSWRF